MYGTVRYHVVGLLGTSVGELVSERDGCRAGAAQPATAGRFCRYCHQSYVATAATAVVAAATATAATATAAGAVVSLVAPSEAWVVGKLAGKLGVDIQVIRGNCS